MKRTFLISYLILLCSGCLLTANTGNEDVSAKLERLFTELRTNLPSVKKIEKNDSVRSLIYSYASSDSVFNHRFSNLKFLGQITSPDSLVKLITWNLILSEGANRYFCYLIRRDGKRTPGKVYSLESYYREATIRTDTIYSSSDWYGALYYDLRPFKTGELNRYIILGIDYGNSLISRKVIDILSFVQGDKILFGHNCITDGNSIVPRVVFEYASSAVMSLKFVSDRQIVFDHLSPFSPELKGNRQFYGPDFSFDSYIFEKDLWRLKSDIDIKNN